MSRIIGLDIIRTTAIILVVLSHAFRFSPLDYWFQLHISPLLGQIGVELFFALSGFLIGRILIKETDSISSTLNPFHFWGRRWLRTLPAYYFILLVFPLINLIINNQPYPNISKYLIFSQNLSTSHPEYFGIAWSLSVEEWSYLIAPIILLLIKFFLPLPGKKVLLCYSLFTILTATIIRSFHPLIHANEVGGWDAFLRKIVIYRIDAIGYGLLAASLSTVKISSRTLSIICTGLICGAALTYLWAGGTIDSINPYTCILLPLLTGSGFAALVLLASRVNSASESKLISAIRFISIISYSLYLIHSPIWEYTLSIFPDTLSATMKWLYFSGYCISSVIIAYLMYKYIEKPFLLLRDKFLP